MKRYLLTLVLAVASAAAISATTGGFTTSDAGIVTPDVATGMRQFTRFNNDVNGDMVVCVHRDHYDSSDVCKSWTPVRAIVPAGRKYVGFRVVSGNLGYRLLEVYWK